jgi:hypothetical protein
MYILSKKKDLFSSSARSPGHALTSSAGCIGGDFLRQAGGQNIPDKENNINNDNMLPKSKLRLVLALMMIIAIIVIGLAIYLAINISNIDMNDGIILFGVGGAGLILVLINLIILLRSLKKQVK